MDIRSSLGRLRIIGYLEGISYLLFAVTMPLKYMYGIKEPNYYVGMIHGVLFILYIAAALQNIVALRWNYKISLSVLAASLIPFATFIVDSKLLKPIYISNK